MLQKWKKWIATSLVAIVVAGLLQVGGAALAATPAGDGTEESPYLIGSVADLLWMNDAISKNEVPNRYFTLTANIDLSSIESWDPIGGSAGTFDGTFDGNGHVISNLKIESTFPLSYSSIGLFSNLNGATIKNLGITNASVTPNLDAAPATGILAGYAQQSTIKNVYTTGFVEGYRFFFTGGIIGYANDNTTISSSYSRAIVSGGFSGTLVGFNDKSVIKNAFGAAVTGQPLVGKNNSELTNVYADGNVQGDVALVAEVENSATQTNVSTLSRSVLTTESSYDPAAGYFENWDFLDTWYIAPKINDGFPLLYEVVINTASSDATLSDIKISAGSLSPAFNKDWKQYEVTVPNTASLITITPTASEPNATIQVEGNTVASGNPSDAISLAVNAEKRITIRVLAADQVTEETYTIDVFRPRSSDATLKSLTCLVGKWNKSFHPSTTAYTLSVPYNIVGIRLDAIANASTSTVANGTKKASKQLAVDVNGLKVGNTTTSFVVTAEDGTKKTYTVTINRAAAPSSDATLKSLSVGTGKLSPAFKKSTKAYKVSVAKKVTSIKVTAAVNQANAKVSIGGTAGATKTVALKVGANAIKVVVTAQNGTKQTYTITVTRAAK